MQVKAAVLRELNAPLVFENLELGAIKPDEVLVRVVATGVCHTDIMMTHGVPVPVQRPFVLGHEGAGVVEAIGDQVKGVAVGSHVVLSFDHCGACHNCHDGHAAYCTSFFVNFSGRRRDGSPSLHTADEVVGSNFFGQSSFSSYVVARAANVVPVDFDLPLEALGPLGCGIQTGAGAIMNVLKPEPGSSIVIFGAGAVGLSAAMAARIMGAGTIIVVDLNADRLALALELGATHVLNASTEKPQPEVMRITGGGANYTLDASGALPAINGAIECLAVRGTCGIVGGGPPVTINTPHLMTGGRTITGIGMGDAVPALLIPKLLAFYRQGRFPFDRLISYYSFDQINDAIADAVSGKAIKPVVRMAA